MIGKGNGMSLNDTPSGSRIHIGFFGRRNAGKSSLINKVTGQEISVVSEKKGTTTDPVTKAMELLPLGPVLMIDTPGFDDDEGTLGMQRVRRAAGIMRRVDVAVLVTDTPGELSPEEQEIAELFQKKEVTFLLVRSKADRIAGENRRQDGLYVSAHTGEGIEELKEAIGALLPKREEKRLVRDLLEPGDLALLVMPIDESAPKGRLILPQVQTMRDILDAGAVSIAVQPPELPALLQKLAVRPKLVITDSQVFEEVAEIVPDEIPLTSFSILMARYKGFLRTAAQGVSALGSLQKGDRVLIAEGCTHHRQCNDIGTVKIPRWLREFTKNRIEIETCSGQSFPEDLSSYRMVLHCGGCMLNEREILWRMKCAEEQGVPFLNYGLTIAFMKGILLRSLEPFPEFSGSSKAVST